MQHEGRTSRRTRFTAEVELDGLIKARLSDVSLGGAFVESRTELTPGSVVQLRFTLVDREVEIAGEVRHCCPGFGAGVRFINLDPRVRQEIERLLASEEDLRGYESRRRWPKRGEKVATVCPECEWHHVSIAHVARSEDGRVHLRCGSCPASWSVPVAALVPLDEIPLSPWRVARESPT